MGRRSRFTVLGSGVSRFGVSRFYIRPAEIEAGSCARFPVFTHAHAESPEVSPFVNLFVV